MLRVRYPLGTDLECFVFRLVGVKRLVEAVLEHTFNSEWSRDRWWHGTAHFLEGVLALLGLARIPRLKGRYGVEFSPITSRIFLVIVGFILTLGALLTSAVTFRAH